MLMESEGSVYTEWLEFDENSIYINVRVIPEDLKTNADCQFKLMLVNRINNVAIENDLIGLEWDKNNAIVKYKLNSSDCVKLLDGAKGDFYIENLNTKKTYRISNQYYGKESKVYFDKITSRFLKIFTTKKGNLSICISKPEQKVDIESVSIKNEGMLVVRGCLNYASLGIDGKSDFSNLVILESKAGKVEVSNSIKRFDMPKVSEKIKYTGIDYSNCGFEIEISILDIESVREGLKNKLILLTEEGREVYINMPMNADPIEKFVIKDGEKWLVSVRGDKSLSVKAKNICNEIEVSKVHIGKKDLEFVLNKSKSNHLISKADLIEVLLKQRYKSKIYILKGIIQFGDRVVITACFGEALASERIELDIYDVYIKIGSSEYRVTSKFDGVKNKKEVVVFPRFYGVDIMGRSVAFEPYYTTKNQLSIKAKKLIEVKQIESVEQSGGLIKLKGVMNIRKPCKEVSNKICGHIRLNLEYGVNIELKYIGNVDFIKNSMVQYDFEMIITKEELKKKKVSPRYVLSNLSNKTVMCTVVNGTNVSEFTFNINAKLVKSTIEDKINKNEFGKFILEKLSIPIYNVFNKVLPIDKKMVMFQSYYGKSYSCNPRAIYEELLASGEEFKCVWILNDVHKVLPGVPTVVRPNSLAYYYYMARSKYFVNNANFPDFYKKRKGAINIETWHGTPLKKLGLDVDEDAVAYENNTSEKLLERVKRWDKLIVPNKYTGEILSRAYQYDNEVMELGYPRNDIFYKNVEKKNYEIRKKLNISPNKKVVMYAPTWRENEKRSGSYKPPFSLEEFKEKFGDEYVLLLRLHHFDTSRVDGSIYDDRVVNVSLYDDIAELYLISDLLITDYSSVMFDYANSRKPMLFYTYDLELYKSKLRGLYIDFENEVPGPLLRTEQELFKAIEDIDTVKEDYSAKYDNFTKKFCSLEDGNASRRVVEKIFLAF